MIERQTVPCELCGRNTPYAATRRCDRCYELESRIQMDPEIARVVLAGIDGGSFARVTIENSKVYRIHSVPTSWPSENNLLPNGDYTLGRVRSE